MSSQNLKPNLRILFHIGAGKTGSTSLQNMLYNNRDLLLEKGIFYQDSQVLAQEIQSGNAGKLFQLLSSGASCSEIKQEITRFVTPDHLSVVSNELLSHLSKDAWQTLFESLKELGVKYQILAFVRSPLGYYLSAFEQVVKRSGFYGNLGEFIEGAQWDHLNMLQNLSHFGSDLNLKVIPYDQNRATLFGTFWDHVFASYGIDVRDLISEDQFLSNRGMSVEEINMLCAISRVHGKEISFIISDFLVNEVEKTGSKLAYSSHQIEKIVNRHQEHIRWINDTFLDSNNEIRNNVDDYTIVDDVQTNAFPDSAITMKVNLFLLRQLDALAEKKSDVRAANLIAKLTEMDYYTTDPDGSRFDNVFYLLKNLDVLGAGETPLEHYLAYGKEEGRESRTIGTPTLTAESGTKIVISTGDKQITILPS